MSKARLYVVTGAGGFIGSHLVELLLEEGHHVRGLIHYNALGKQGHLEEVLARGRSSNASWRRQNRLEIIAGDIQDARCVRDLTRKADVVCHLAALIGIPYSYRAPESYMNTNIRGTLNVLEACRERGVSLLIHTSTSETLGNAQVVPQNESHPLSAQSPYAATKIAADQLALSYHRSFGLPVVVLRPFNTYGPRQSARAIIPTIFTQAFSEECEEIYLGALEPIRDLTYVEDTARGFLRIAEADVEKVAGRVYHLGSEQGISIRDLAQLALRITQRKKTIARDPCRVRPSASEVQALVCDASLLREKTGWAPQIPLEEGLRRTARWIEKRLSNFRAGEYML